MLIKVNQATAAILSPNRTTLTAAVVAVHAKRIQVRRAEREAALLATSERQAEKDRAAWCEDEANALLIEAGFEVKVCEMSDNDVVIEEVQNG